MHVNLAHILLIKKTFEQFVKIAVSGKSSLSRYISHGFPAGPGFRLILLKYSNLLSRTKCTQLSIKFRENAKVRAVVNGEEENCKSFMQNCEYPVTWVAAQFYSFSHSECIEE